MLFPKLSSIFNLLFIFCWTASFTLCQDISVFGNVIYDLWAPASKFSTQTAPWTATLLSNPANKYASCTEPALGGCGIIGVYGLYLRTYTNLPPHNYIFYSFDFYTRNGQWESRVTWSLDNNALLPWYYVCLMTSLPTQNSCNCAQYKASAVGAIPHTASTLTFNFSGFAGVATPDQSFRNIKIILSNVTTTTATNQVIVDSACKGYTRQNPCLNGQYQDPTNPGTCLPCSSKCSTCYGPSDSECYSCAYPGGFDGSQCVSCTPGCNICSDSSTTGCSLCDDSHYLDWENSCVSSCSSPYVTVYDGLVRKCQTPCQASNEFFMWDETCSSTCPTPYVTRIEGNAKFCDFPCTGADFLLWDNNCDSTCDDPYVTRVQGGKSFCDYPCANTADYYYLDESRCDTACAGDYQVLQTDFCVLNPRCTSTEFYYWNQTCQGSCDTPLAQRTQGNAQFCDFPCADTTNYYLPQEQTCSSTCLSPYQVVQSIFCIDDTPQSQSETQELRAVKTMHSVLTPFNTVLTGLLSLFDSRSPTSFNLFALLTLLEYIKYMKVNYPPKLQSLLDEQAFDFYFTESLPDIEEKLQNKFSDHLLPENFEKYGLASSFIVNFWDSLLFLIMIGLLVLLVLIVNKIKFKSALLEKIKKKINIAIKWNFLFSSLTVLYSSMVLFTSFELRTLNFNTFNKFDIFSFITCLLTNFTTVFMIFKMFHIIFEVRKTAHKKEEYEVIYETFKSNSFLQQAFMPIFTLRVILFAMIIAYLFEYPFIQAVLMTSGGIFMILYLIIFKPLVERLELLEYIFSEIVIFCVNVCLFIFAVLDETKQDSQEVRQKLGTAVIALNVALTLLIFVYNAVRTIIMIKDIYYKLKAYYKQSKATKVQPISNQGKENKSLAFAPADKSAISIKDISFKSQGEFDEKNLLVKAGKQSNSSSPFHGEATLQSQRQLDLNDDSAATINSLVLSRSPSKNVVRSRSRYGTYKKIFPSSPHYSDSEAKSMSSLKCAEK